jgi:hypothetical protein
MDQYLVFMRTNSSLNRFNIKTYWVLFAFYIYFDCRPILKGCQLLDALGVDRIMELIGVALEVFDGDLVEVTTFLDCHLHGIEIPFFVDQLFSLKSMQAGCLVASKLR